MFCSILNKQNPQLKFLNKKCYFVLIFCVPLTKTNDYKLSSLLLHLEDKPGQNVECPQLQWWAYSRKNGDYG